ncbi:glycosyltransferase [Deferribacter autotrophicus]|uniref:Glycosyltransferase n=1 Tax=Deferribacter autotrophicus TaxID=500465 RepID=A0A5A8F6J2_9BACT|nr:glycosyltransferase [Deferribacter autotrophicus]KAA0257324.1 glycosyltransferase [Deferribacter autotrophicus]
MKYNVAILHYSAPPVIGGVEEVIKQQAFLFRRNLISVKIVAGKGEQFDKLIPVETNPLLASDSEEIAKSVESALKGNMEYLFKLKENIKNYLINSVKDFDFLVVHNILNMKYNLPAAMAIHEIANEKITKVISWCHDSLYFYDNYNPIFDKEPFNILKKYNENITYVAISKSRQKLFASLFNISENKIHVIKNGVDPVKFFMLDTNTVKIIKQEDLYNCDLLLVQPSRLHPRKNIELTIKVIKALIEKGVNAKALITGAFDPHEKSTIEYYDKLCNLIKDLKVENNAILLAKYILPSGEAIQSNKIKIKDIYHLADILFLPSTQEGFGIPLLEAGMLKIPVVCSNIPPFKEIAGEYVTFFDLNEDINSIADKIIKVSKTYKTSLFFRKVLKEYSLDNIFKEKINPLLTSLL